MKRTLFSFFSIFLVTMLLADCKNACAGDIPPDAVEITTPVYTPEPGAFHPRFGKYSYSVSWQGIPAGTLTLNLREKGPDYRIRASARTNRFVDLFYKLRFHTEAFVSAETLHPRISVYNRKDDRSENTKIEFLPGGEIRSFHENHRGKVEKYRFNPDNFTLDPFSAVFLALSLNWEIGDTRRFDTFTGTGRYLVELTAVEKTDIDVDGSRREAVVISPGVINLTQDDTGEEDDRLREARIYISTDPSREILRIESDVFIGTVSAQMDSFTPRNGEDAALPFSENTPENPPAPGWQGPHQAPSRQPPHPLFPITGSAPEKSFPAARLHRAEGDGFAESERTEKCRF